MATTRRQFLVAGLGAAAIPLLARLSFAQALAGTKRRDRALVLLDMAGGNDGLNTVIPCAHSRYHELRPTLHVAPGDVLPLSGGDGCEVGLHPGLTGLQALFDQGRLAVVQGVGYPQPDRSHFRSTDIWHAASLTPETTKTGWIGRASELDLLAGQGRTPSLMIGSDNIPLLLVGERGIAPQVASLDRFKLPTGPQDEGRSARADAMRALALAQPKGSIADPGRLDFLRDAARSTQESAVLLEEAAAHYHSTVDYPATALGAQLKLAAQLIAGGFDCTAYYLRQPGYDTHAFQSVTHGLLLRELGDALAAFMRDLQAADAATRVAVMVSSEFGRRVAENGSRGTDHGAAAPVFLLGGALRGGIVGAHPSLDEHDLDDGDITYSTDFRRVYATLLEDWLEVPSERVLGESFEKLPLFGELPPPKELPKRRAV